MSKSVVVRYRVRPEAAEENRRLIEGVFAELRATRPDGVTYSSMLLDDGVTFVHTAAFDVDDTALTSLASFRAFQADIQSRFEAAPEVNAGALVGSYNAQAFMQ